MLKALRYGLILLAGIGMTSLITANNSLRPITPVQEDTSKKINIIHSRTMTFVTKDSVDERRFSGDVAFRQATSYLYCDSAILNQAKNMIEAWGRVHIIQDDSIHTYSDHLIYMGNTRIATLDGNAKLTDTKIVLTSPELQYDMNTKIGTYTKTGKLVNEKSVLTSQEGFYYADTKDVYFKKNVVIVDPGFTLGTDTLLYNTTTKIATILAPTTINDGKMTMYVTDGYYNTDAGYGSFSKRPVIEDSTNTFTANEIQTDKASGISIATGNMIWRDTAQKVSLLANYGIVNQFNKTVLATRKPVMLLEGKTDTLFVASDTLFSGIVPRDTVLVDSTTATDQKDTTEKRFVIAYNHVKIYSDSLQGVADSLYYSGVDSIFRLYKDPVLWANGSQLTGDTIFLFTKNQKADKLLMDQNALIVNEVGPGMYNQVKGNTILGFFGEEKLDSMYVNGNAENIYYVQDDDSAFISINRLLSAATHIYFSNGELDRVVFVKEAEATMYPFTQMPEEQKQLPGFKWVINRKPKSKYELIGQ
ncbi:OstA-like protein [Chitinophaga niabensis]|uniref:OstA-like protein n=1 Tax=Chitinophaga niabensis TaxID=536979 RepID=UPI0031BA1020